VGEGDFGGEVRGRARVYCVSVMGIQMEGRRGRGEEWKMEGGRWKVEGGKEGVGLVDRDGWNGEDMRLWWREEGVEFGG